LDIKKDCAFNTRVTGAHFDKPSGKWITETEDGRTAKSKYLLLALGFAAKRHFPDWPGMEDFKGELHHSSFWPNKVSHGYASSEDPKNNSFDRASRPRASVLVLSAPDPLESRLRKRHRRTPHP
jgi:hypothetical protein